MTDVNESGDAVDGVRLTPASLSAGVENQDSNCKPNFSVPDLPNPVPTDTFGSGSAMSG